MSKKAQSVSIISGADGPTSIFLAGREDKKGIRRIRNSYQKWKYRKKRKKAEKQIIPSFHSLEETRTFIRHRYQGIEANVSYPCYEEDKRRMKYSIIQREQPELIGADKPLIPPDQIELQNQDILYQWLQEVETWTKQCVERLERLPENVCSIQYHLYLIDCGDDGQIKIEMEDNRGIMCISASSSGSGNMKKMQKVIKDIYLYYGVTQEDIDKHTERYQILVTELSQ